MRIRRRTDDKRYRRREEDRNMQQTNEKREKYLSFHQNGESYK
jgi:hypothetical protein